MPGFRSLLEPYALAIGGAVDLMEAPVAVSHGSTNSDSVHILRLAGECRQFAPCNF